MNCDKCGEEMTLPAEDTILGDKYGCKNETCINHVKDDPNQ